MKDYLNQEEHRLEVYYMAMYGYMTIQLASYKQNMCPKEITYMKYIQTYIDKMMGELEKRVGRKELERITRDALNSEVRLLPRNRNDKQFVVNKEPLEGALLYAVEAKCKDCTRTDFENCHLWQCMDECGMGSAKEKKSKGCEFGWSE